MSCHVFFLFFHTCTFLLSFSQGLIPRSLSMIFQHMNKSTDTEYKYYSSHAHFFFISYFFPLSFFFLFFLSFSLAAFQLKLLMSYSMLHAYIFIYSYIHIVATYLIWRYTTSLVSTCWTRPMRPRHWNTCRKSPSCMTKMAMPYLRI
jgi:hypothetical protein